jgi:hypothetical protein
MPGAGHLNQDSISALFEKGTYFDDYSAFHLSGHPVPGMEGEWIPYALQDDLCVLSILVFSFLLMCFVLNRGHLLILHQIKDFFVERERGNLFVETGNEFRYQLFLILNTALLLGLILYALFLNSSEVFSLYPTWFPLSISVAACIIAYLLKILLYSFVNWVFFDKVQNERWMEIYSLVISIQGVLLFLLACFIIFIDLSVEQGLIALSIILLIAKLLLFCKSFSIFFANLQGFLCNILYFCTLEMIPLLYLLKIITEVNKSWTFNF